MSTDANNNIESHVQVLSYLFKGIIVTASPICGWLVLKIILAIFTNPSYFFFTWLAILGIGLLAEIFTDSWRPSQSLSRLRNNPGGSNGEGCGPLRETSSPTVIYKSGNTGTGESSKSDEKLGKKKKNTNFNLDATESRESIQFEANDKQLDSSSTSFDLIKRFGKPVLLRVDKNKNYQHLSKSAATHNLNEELSPDQTDNSDNVGANKKEAYEACKLLSKLHGLVHVNANKEWGLFGSVATAPAEQLNVDPLEKEMKCLHEFKGEYSNSFGHYSFENSRFFLRYPKLMVIMVSLNPNIQRLRQRIRLETGGDGDHSRTLMETLSNPFVVHESVINRLLGVSLAFLIIFMLSHQLVLAYYLYEFAKPVYVVYASATVLVDLVAPALRRIERWLVADQVDGVRSVANMNDMFFDELMDSFSEAEDDEEQNDNNNVFRTGRSTDADSSRPRVTSGSKGRQLRSRGRTGETRPMILKAIESELKKDKRT